jgi:hypothetical protein
MIDLFDGVYIPTGVTRFQNMLLSEFHFSLSISYETWITIHCILNLIL